MSNPQFKRSADAHCIYEECQSCQELLIFSLSRATEATIAQAKREHTRCTAAA